MSLSLDPSMSVSPLVRAAAPLEAPAQEEEEDAPAGEQDAPPEPGPRSSTGAPAARALASAEAEPGAALDPAAASLADSDSLSVETQAEPVIGADAFADEATEAVEAPMPAIIAVRLADEPLPWPVVLVLPTVVLPGTWPPPLSTLGASEPSGVMEAPSVVEELQLDLEGSVDDSLADDLLLQSGELALDPEMPAPFGELSNGAIIAALSTSDSIDEPPVRGTLDGLPVVEPTASADEDANTEVSDRDALEDALAVLRGAPEADLSLDFDLVEHDEPPDAVIATSEDLLSLEFDTDADIGLVDPDVRADLAMAGLPSGAFLAVTPSPSPGLWIELGEPSPAVVFSPQPAVWLQVTDPTGAGLRGESPDVLPEDDELSIQPPAAISMELEADSVEPSWDGPIDSSRGLEDDLLLDELDPADELDEPGLYSGMNGALTAPPSRPMRSGEDSVEALLLVSDVGQAVVTLDGDSVIEAGPLASLEAEAGAVRVDLGLGAPPPDRAGAHAGVAVAAPQRSRAREGKGAQMLDERTVDLVALARSSAAEPGSPSGEVARELTHADAAIEPDTEADDWLAELDAADGDEGEST